MFVCCPRVAVTATTTVRLPCTAGYYAWNLYKSVKANGCSLCAALSGKKAT
jgi:hypothetical protein